MSGWISVTERQPEDEEVVLAWADCVLVAMYWVRLGEWWDWGATTDAPPFVIRPTHWMPLPDPPEAVT